MKKALKIFGITVGSLVGLVVLVVLIACWLVFTPARLTPIVGRVADKFLTCDTRIGRVNLTLFKTFPQLGLDVKDVVLINPTEGAETDTVAALGRLTLEVDAKAFLKERAIIVRGLDIADGQAYLFTSAEGRTNLDIFPKSEKEKSESSFDLSTLDVDIDHVKIENLSATLDNRKAGLRASAEGLGLKLNGTMKEGTIDATVEGTLADAFMKKDDSMDGGLSGLKLKADVKGKGLMDCRADVTLSTDDALVTLPTLGATTGAVAISLVAAADTTGYTVTPMAVNVNRANVKKGDEQFLTDAVISVKADEVKADRTFRNIIIRKGNVSLNQFDVAIDGTLASTADDDKSSTGKSSDSKSLEAHITTNRWDLREVLAVLPASISKKLTAVKVRDGAATIDAEASATIGGGKFDIRKADASVALERISGTVGKDMSVASPRLTATVAIPAKATTKQFKEFAQGTLKATRIDLKTKGLDIHEASNIAGTFSLSDVMDKRVPFSVKAKLALDALAATMDTIDARFTKPVVEAMMVGPKNKNGRTQYEATITTAGLDGKAGRLVTATTGSLTVKGKASPAANAKAKGDFLTTWSPALNVSLKEGHAETTALPMPVEIPTIRFDFTPGRFTIDDSRIRLGKNDLGLTGDVTNLDDWMAGKGLLTGRMNLKSDYLDVTEIMDLVSGLGGPTPDPSRDGGESGQLTSDSEASPSTGEREEGLAFADDEVKEDNPFMVPLGFDVFLRTDVKTAMWNGFDFHNVGGKITVRDGVLVLEELGFTSKAATMQLTAMYKSPRKNHLFAGVDFHLIDIDIDDLIRMIPKVDSIVPMLKSFDGQAQFHLAGESYLKSNYDLKLSTLRGAASIEGKDLVVVPSSTFETIKKYLMTDKSTENRIDSLDVELSVFKDEVDLYPFRVRLGQYEAIVAGRHNINRDFDFNYHLSVTDAPVPVRLGLDVSGTLDDMHFKLAPCRYNNLYRPERRNGIQERTLQLKTLINESLKRNVKPVEYYSE